MTTFGKRLRECRDAKKLSQQDIAKKMKTSYTVIGKYERDEMIPSIEVAKTLAQLLETTVGYLLGEVKLSNTFKDPAMLKRLNEISDLPEKDKEHILYTIDGLLQNVKTKSAFAS
jgi:transcriptional regulator with XRE-family HTH domain